jgi:hypothetical protein
MCGQSFSHHHALLRHKRTNSEVQCRRQDSHNHFGCEAAVAGEFVKDIWDGGTSNKVWEDWSADELQTKNPLLMLQQRLVARSTPGSLPPFLVNKVFDVLTEKREDCSWIDYLDVYYVINKTALSMTDADEMLRTFIRILLRKDMHSTLPKSCRVIKKAVQKAVLSHFTYVTFKFRLPYEWFTAQYAAMESVASGHFITVMEVLAEMLIEIPVESFNFFPVELRNQDGERMFREPATGHVFKEYCKIVKEKCGDGVYPLTIVINGDSLILNKTGICHDIKMTLRLH